MDTTREDDCIPWDPIPPEQNVYFDVTVVAFEQTIQGGSTKLSVLLFHSAVNGSGFGSADADIWRIEFEGTFGFRRRLIPHWKDADPFPRPSDRTKTFWEVAPSSLARRSIGPKDQYAIRHFVIASDYDAFEILALSWTTTHVSHEEVQRLLENK